MALKNDMVSDAMVDVRCSDIGENRFIMGGSRQGGREP
jgi:hypothetical protein